MISCHPRSSIPERRPEVTGSDDSEGSTDSDEELDSPAVIRQTPPAPRTTENMDIDNASEGEYKAACCTATGRVGVRGQVDGKMKAVWLQLLVMVLQYVCGENFGVQLEVMQVLQHLSVT